MNVGAEYLGEFQCRFCVWAPFAENVVLTITSPHQREEQLSREENGYWKGTFGNIFPGTQYRFLLGTPENRFPDPASRYQPGGVHGLSEVIDHTSFEWHDQQWTGILLADYVIYELHVGTFTQEGSFEAIIPRLKDLHELGITALEIMPVAQFAGWRNWGYDGVYPFAVQNSYGGPDGFKKLIDACHQNDLAVILDVVYNHLGPEGNYLSQFGPYFTEKYKSSWGSAINFDDQYSDDVRNYFLDNALYWLREFHIDALRLDAVHAILDFSAKPFLAELADAVLAYARDTRIPRYVIAESDLSNSIVLRPRKEHGFGHHAQWLDDLHHAMRTLLVDEQKGYYTDYGQMEHLLKAMNDGFVYSGQYSKSRKRRHGDSSREFSCDRFIVFSQNHDQIGNRMLGERLSQLLTFEQLKLVAGTYLLSPYIPMVYMGEEYAEDSPFLYFVSHSDEGLIDAVRKGRKEEFAAFQWDAEPPDPQSEETFLRSKLKWESRCKGKHQIMLRFYRALLQLRRDVPALQQRDRNEISASGSEETRVMSLLRTKGKSRTIGIFNYHSTPATWKFQSDNRSWKKLIDSADGEWEGPASECPATINTDETLTIPAYSFVLYQKEESNT